MWLNPWHGIKPGKLAHALSSSSVGDGGRGSGVQGYLQLHSDFDANLG